jgi:hypothetical protein
MKIYEFPGKPPTVVEPTAQSTPDHSRLHLGPIGFTCPHCDTASELHFDGMIFRAVEFHCGCCGNFFKLTNPAFTTPPTLKKPK